MEWGGKRENEQGVHFIGFITHVSATTRYVLEYSFQILPLKQELVPSKQFLDHLHSPLFNLFVMQMILAWADDSWFCP